MGRYRNKGIYVRLTESEKKTIQEKAKTMQMNTSEIIRRVMLQGKFATVNTNGLDKLAYEVNKVGININQIAKKLNSDNQPINDYDREVIAKTQETLNLINKNINGLYRVLLKKIS